MVRRRRVNGGNQEIVWAKRLLSAGEPTSLLGLRGVFDLE